MGFSVSGFLEGINQLATHVREFMSDRSDARDERSGRLGAHLDRVAATLDLVASELELQQSVSGRCGELHGYLFDFADTIRPALSKESVQKLEQEIQTAYQVEELAMVLDADQDEAERQEAIEKLRRSAGVFRSAANTTRARR